MIEIEKKLLIYKAKTFFNCLQLAIIEALIFWHFYPEYHI